MKWLYVLTCILVVTTGCSTNASKGTNSNAEQIQKIDVVERKTIVEEQKTLVEEQYMMPLEMPDEFDFSVQFGYGEFTKNEINTFNDTVTKDLITKGTATAELKFSSEEMNSIYMKMLEINMMEMKEDLSTESSCAKIPYNEDIWEVNVDGTLRAITWTDQHCDVSEEANQLLELRVFIREIVEEKETYKQLPEAEGGYE